MTYNLWYSDFAIYVEGQDEVLHCFEIYRDGAGQGIYAPLGTCSSLKKFYWDFPNNTNPDTHQWNR